MHLQITFIATTGLVFSCNYSLFFKTKQKTTLELQSLGIQHNWGYVYARIT